MKNMILILCLAMTFSLCGTSRAEISPTGPIIGTVDGDGIVPVTANCEADCTGRGDYCGYEQDVPSNTTCVCCGGCESECGSLAAGLNGGLRGFRAGRPAGLRQP